MLKSHEGLKFCFMGLACFALLSVFVPADLAAVEPGPADPDAPKEFSTTPSGLKYRILRKGSDQKPKATDKVKVHYKGLARRWQGLRQFLQARRADQFRSQSGDSRLDRRHATGR